MGKNIRGALSYNEQKVGQGTAELILASRFGRDISEMGFSEKLLRFEKLNQLNEKTKTNTLHLSLNFSPDDQLDQDKLIQIAFDYMERIGFGGQPFLVYQHTDTGHPHLHIVTNTIKPNGKAIFLHNLAKRKSEPARKAIEFEYNLVEAKGRKQSPYLGESTSISSKVSRIVAEYKFSSLDELNAILRQFNLIADRGNPDSFLFQKNGLVFCQIDKDGHKIGKSIKASSIYKSPTLSVLEKKFEQNNKIKTFYKKRVQSKVSIALAKSSSTFDFLENLKSKDLGCSIQYGAGEQITRISFVDHSTKTVFQSEDIGLTIPGILEKLNYQKSISPSTTNQSASSAEMNTSAKDSFAQSPFVIIKTLLTAENFQPQVPPGFLKKKRKKKKR